MSLTPRSLPNLVELPARRALEQWKAIEAWLESADRLNCCAVFQWENEQPDWWQHLGSTVNNSHSGTFPFHGNRWCDPERDAEQIERYIWDCETHDEDVFWLFAFDDASDAMLFKLSWLGA